jgi:class 3 adenylate cyclase
VAGAVVRSAEREEWSSFGSTVNLARRLQETAAREGLATLLGPCAARLVGSLPTRALGPRSLKGFSQEVNVFELKSE